MSAYDEIEIEDMEWSESAQAFTYSCPCGDLFQITVEELRQGEEIAHCPSCTLFIRVIFNQADFLQEAESEPEVQPDPRPPPVAVA